MTPAAFLKMNHPITFIRNLARPSKQLFLGKGSCLNISLFSLVWLVFLFCETNSITRKSIFWRNFRWSTGPEHLALTAWKRYYLKKICHVQAEDCDACLHETLSTWYLGFISLSFWYKTALLFLDNIEYFSNKAYLYVYI